MKRSRVGKIQYVIIPNVSKNIYNPKVLFTILLVERVAIPGAVPTVKDDRIPVDI